MDANSVLIFARGAYKTNKWFSNLWKLTVYHKSLSLKCGYNCDGSGCWWTLFPFLSSQVTLFFTTVAGEDGGEGKGETSTFFFCLLNFRANFVSFLSSFLPLSWGGCDWLESSCSILTMRRFFNGRVDFKGNDMIQYNSIYDSFPS